MVFSSLTFIYRFLPVFLLLYFLIPRGKRWSTDAKNAVLTLGSLFFYAWGEPRYVLLMLVSIAVNYRMTMAIAAERKEGPNGRRRRKRYFLIAVIFDLGMLFVFKYTGFVMHNINLLLHSADLPLIPEIYLENPIGISFYTFQMISYVTDVYRRVHPAERSPLKVATYISAFPQLIAGPIVNWGEVRDAISERSVSAEDVAEGVKLFILGLGAKVLIANRIGVLWTDLGRIGYESISAPLAWMGSWAYSFQIYFDFYGYSMMAIGLGRMLGFSLPENFRDPYVSRSASEFWRRWHITLGRWFREYVYIPLGGNRKGKLRTVRNLLVVWLLTGLWHGAEWNFVIWGLLFFVLLTLERLFWGRCLEKLRFLSVPYMLLVIPLSWTIFAVTDMQQLGIYFTRLFPFLPANYDSNVNPSDFLRYGETYLLSFASALLFCIPPVKRFLFRRLKGPVGVIACLLIFFLSVYFLAQGLDNPFLYYRF